MRKIRISLLFVFILAGLSFSEVAGDKIKSLEVELYGQYPVKKVNILKYKGKVIYLKIWAQWCWACRKSFSHTKKIAAKYGPKGLVTFIVGVSAQDPEVKFLKSLHANFTVIGSMWSGLTKLKRRFQFRGIPHAMLIAKSGRIIFKGHPANITNSMIENALGISSNGANQSNSGSSSDGGYSEGNDESGNSDGNLK